MMRTTNFVSNNTTFIMPGDTQREASELLDAGDLFLASINEMFRIFHFSQSDLIFGNRNPFSCMFNAVSSGL